MTASYQPTQLADDFAGSLSVDFLMRFNSLSSQPEYATLTDADLVYALFKTCARYVASSMKQAAEMGDSLDMGSKINMSTFGIMVYEARHNMDNASEDVKQRAESMLNDMGIGA